MRLAREAIGDRRVGSDTFAEALQLFGEEQLILYVSLIGHYSALACLLHVFANHPPEQPAGF